MTTGNITLSAVRTMAPGETIWDAGHREAVRGFGVRKQKSAAVYILKYRIFGRQRFFTIGSHGSPWTPELARKEAKKQLGLVANGKDPADAKAHARLQAADTLRKVADEYLAYVEKKQKPRSYTETKRHLIGEKGAWKPLHPVSVFNLSRRHISSRLAEIFSRSGPTAASHARAALSAMFNWAIKEGLDLPSNPVAGTNKPLVAQPHDRVLSDAELKVVWSACDDDDYGRIIRLLMLTGQRRDEVGGMQWTELDTVNGLWTLPGLRTKNNREHAVPLVPAAIALLPIPLNKRDHLFGEGPRRNGDPHRGFSGWSKSKAALDARIAEEIKKTDSSAKPLPAWTVHDLRRTVATNMADRLGVLPHVIEAVLNHVSGHRAGVAGVYNRARYQAEMRDALDRWSDHLAALVNWSITARGLAEAR